jgi:hypothetical protein
MFIKADKYLKQNFFGSSHPPFPSPPLLLLPRLHQPPPPPSLRSWVAKLLAEHSELFLKASACCYSWSWLTLAQDALSSADSVLEAWSLSPMPPTSTSSKTKTKTKLPLYPLCRILIPPPPPPQPRCLPPPLPSCPPTSPHLISLALWVAGPARSRRDSRCNRPRDSRCNRAATAAIEPQPLHSLSIQVLRMQRAPW